MIVTKINKGIQTTRDGFHYLREPFRQNNTIQIIFRIQKIIKLLMENISFENLNILTVAKSTELPRIWFPLIAK